METQNKEGRPRRYFIVEYSAKKSDGSFLQDKGFVSYGDVKREFDQDEWVMNYRANGATDVKIINVEEVTRKQWLLWWFAPDRGNPDVEKYLEEELK